MRGYSETFTIEYFSDKNCVYIEHLLIRYNKVIDVWEGRQLPFISFVEFSALKSVIKYAEMLTKA